MIQVSNLTKSFGDQLIFQNITFSINRREIVGLVGRNGSGKSTIFKILMEELASDFGTIIIPKKYKMGLLSQHIKFSKKTILDECVLALPEQRVYDTYIVEKILFDSELKEFDAILDQIAAYKVQATKVHLKCVYETKKVLTEKQLDILTTL